MSNVPQQKLFFPTRMSWPFTTKLGQVAEFRDASSWSIRRPGRPKFAAGKLT